MGPLPPQLAAQLQHLLQRRPPRQRALAGPLDHRPIRDGIGKRHAQLEHVRAGVNRRERNFVRGFEIRITAGEIDDYPRTARELNH